MTPLAHSEIHRTPVRTLMVDDHATFVDELVSLLEETRETDVVGRAASGEDALEQTSALRPDLVLVDLGLSGMSGLEATRLLRIDAGAGSPLVIAMSVHEHSIYQQAAMDAGANGFIPKSKMGTMLLPMIRSLFPAVVQDAVPK